MANGQGSAFPPGRPWRIRWPEQSFNRLQDIAGNRGGSQDVKRVAPERPHATRFRLLFLCMSLSQNRCALLGDMH